MTTPRNPTPAYTNNPQLYGDKELYAKLQKLIEGNGGKAGRELSLVEEFEVPIRSGRAWVVKKGTFNSVHSSFPG